jgi:uncharacterized Zn finger protein
MSDIATQVAVTCPSCSPEAETVHEVLKPDEQATVRCTECGHTHKTRIESERTVEADVIVSQEGESFAATVDVPADEQVAVGEEFVLETDEAIMLVRITSIELGGDRRVERAHGEELGTLWTRAVDNVEVNATIHPSDKRDESRSVKLQVPGDHEFIVGVREEHGDEEFTVTGIHVENDADGYERTKLDFDGDSVPAKDVKRLYAEDESSSAWSAW